MAWPSASLPYLLVALLLAPALAGCLGGGDEAVEPQAAPPQLPTLIELTEDDRVTFEVPVDIVLVGFPAEVAAGLSAKLTDEAQAYATLDAPRNLPDDAMGAGFGLDPMPVVPTATFRVHQAPAALTAALLETARASTVEEPVTDSLDILDANAVEEAFATLAPEYGLTLDPNLNSLVLLHLGTEGEHAYRYTGQTGFREPVRVFGERLGPVFFDASAAEDPWVEMMKGQLDAYDRPLPAATGSVDALAEVVEEVTRFRLLQAAIYPATTKPCHAVTLVLAVRSTTVTDKLLGMAPADTITRVDELESVFENLTREDNVFVDLVVVELPQGDPGLDLLARDPGPTRLDMMRFWLEMNWDRYWVEHEGCEPYVSFLLYGDLVDTSGGGIALYDVGRDRRISLSAVNELTRVRHEYHGAGEEYVNTLETGQTSGEWAMRLFSHETGHLMAQRHPHDITMENDGDYNPSFSSVWSTMSYQQRYRIFDFGTVDQNNYARNRAGFLVQEALEMGLAEDPVFDEALDHLGLYHWHRANELLTTLVNAP